MHKSDIRVRKVHAIRQLSLLEVLRSCDADGYRTVQQYTHLFYFKIGKTYSVPAQRAPSVLVRAIQLMKTQATYLTL